MTTPGERIEGRMSYGLTVYVVSLPKLRALPGSRDRKLIKRAQASSFVADQIDEMVQRHNEDSDEEGQIRVSFADAVAQLVTREVPPDVPHYAGFVYGYAFEAICAGLGDVLDNDSVPGLDFDELDEFLKSNGVPLEVLELTCGGAPIEVPPADDWPSIGWWSPEQIAKATRPLSELDLEDAEDEISECVEQIRAWVAEARRRKDACLVGFVY
jgi:hypothetical protein